MKRDTEPLAYGLLLLPYIWKKNHIYTLIEYDDEDTQKIVLDFEKGDNYAEYNI